MVAVLRTPDERFAGLTEAGEAAYADVPFLDDQPTRMAYLDVSPSDSAVDGEPGVVVLLHGEPTWSYLYRTMIPVLTGAGLRVVAPDMIGFGRSDKPVAVSDHTYARHVSSLKALLVDHLRLSDATVVGQDWGGLIGLRLVAAQPDRFARVAVGNTGLPDGRGEPSEAFMQWQKFSQESPVFPIGTIIDGGCATTLSPEVIAAYDAPFPDDSYKAGARIWPSFVPVSADDPEAPANREAWKALERFDRPFLCCFSDQDPVTGGGERAFIGRVPGADGQAHTTIIGGGHFLQEDCGPELAQVLIDFIAA